MKQFTFLDPLSGRPSGLRRFILLWVAIIIGGFSLLSGGLYLSISKLHWQTDQLYSDSQSLGQNYSLESAAREAGRQALLSRTDPKGGHQEQRDMYMRNALYLAAQLQSEGQNEGETNRQTAKEHALIQQILLKTNAFAHRVRGGPGEQAALDELLQAVAAHRQFDEAQMADTLRNSDRVDFLVDAWMIVLTLLTALTTMGGAAILWGRIFRPALELESAARRFGNGDLKARARVRRDDEMGLMCDTFNDMAQTICDREKDRLQFVVTVAHDLKNPLVVIGGAAHFMERKDTDMAPEDRQKWLATIRRNATQMENLIADLTDAVQTETGQIKLHRETFDLAALVRHSISDQAMSVNSHQMHCNTIEECPINADKRRVERVLLNLVSNAVKYSPDGTQVWVGVQAFDGHAQLTVRDEGAGIAPEELKTLFRPFARLERTENMAKGTGLGLSSVKKIIEAHDGAITVQSAVEEGTMVTVKLPLEVKEPQAVEV